MFRAVVLIHAGRSLCAKPLHNAFVNAAKLCLHPKVSYNGTMFTRFALIVLIAVAANFVFAQTDSRAGLVFEASRVNVLPLDEGAFQIDLSIAHHLSPARIYSDPTNECCRAALLNTSVSCAPDSAVSPGSLPDISFNLLLSRGAFGEIAPNGIVASGIYRPPIS